MKLQQNLGILAIVNGFVQYSVENNNDIIILLLNTLK